MKALARIACVLLAGLLGACGGGTQDSNGTSGAPAQPDARLVLDSMAWDQGNWAE